MRKKGLKIIIYFAALFVAFSAKAQVFDVIVDRNGGGDFTSVQEAINSVPNNLSERTLIFVKRGLYNEKVVVSASKTNISLIGENAEKVIISWDDYQGKGNISGADSYTLWSDSPGFYAENITVENTSGNVGQAVAIRTTGDTMVFRNCRFLGFQDTYYAHKRRQYNLNCYIEGATDFIYGDATTVFDSCTINCVNGGQYISAPADTKLVTPLVNGDFLHGLLFRFCDVTANSDVSENSYFLGRPWQPKSSSVYIECKLGPHIKPEGWSVWGGTNNHLSSVFAEYKNLKPDETPADVSNRVAWSTQLDDATVANLYKLDFFLRKDGKKWDPKLLTQALPAPGNFNVNDNELTWNEVENAIGYVVLADDSVIGFTKSNSFLVPFLVDENLKFDVKSVSKNGNLSIKSSEITTAVHPLNFKENTVEILLLNRKIQFSEEVNFKIYTASGQLMMIGKSTDANLHEFKSGIYLIHAISNNGEKISKKIIL